MKTEMADEHRGWPVLVDPLCEANKRKHPGSVGKILYRKPLNKQVVIIYLPDYDKYEAYRSGELLAPLPGNGMLDNLVDNYGSLSRKDITDILEVYSLFQERIYEDAFKLAMKNTNITSLCIANYETLLSTV